MRVFRSGFGNVYVDVTMDLYLESVLRTSEFSAFVDGSWIGRTIATSGDGRLPDSAAAARSESASLELTLVAPSGNTPVRYVIPGSPDRLDRPFQVFVSAYADFVSTRLGTLTAECVEVRASHWQ